MNRLITQATLLPEDGKLGPTSPFIRYREIQAVKVEYNHFDVPLVVGVKEVHSCCVTVICAHPTLRGGVTVRLIGDYICDVGGCTGADDGI